MVSNSEIKRKDDTLKNLSAGQFLLDSVHCFEEVEGKIKKSRETGVEP